MLCGIITVILFLVALIAVYVLYMSRQNGKFKKYGFESGKVRLLMGSITTEPFMKQIVDQYKTFKNKKAYAVYAPGSASIVVSDLDLVQDIFIRHFNNFCDRRHTPKTGKYVDHMITVLTGDHWKHVRSVLSPAFSSSKMKRISKLVEKTAQILVTNLEGKMERNESVDMKAAMSCFSMDAIANSGFGIDLDSVNDPQNRFLTAGKKMLEGVNRYIIIFGFMPFLVPILRFLGIDLVNGDSLDFYSSFVDKAMKERKSEGASSQRNDFLQLIVDAERENEASQEKGDETKQEGSQKTYRGLSYEEIQGAALVYIFGSYDNVSTALSFVLFLLAMNPEALKKVQQEIDEKLGSEIPTYENVSELKYLDMCLEESLRLYPPGFVLERLCVEETEIRGITFPKDAIVQVPAYAIHRDPELWGEDPDEFKPERFSPEQKASRHQYSYLPFGFGPRNCIGMRLAQLQVKIGAAAVLQKLTPVACDKTVYPIELESLRMQAKDGLWLKMEKRQ